MKKKLKTGLLLLGLWVLHLPPVVAETEALEFRHGVSQIPNYELKYPRDFTHFDYVNLDESDAAKQVSVLVAVPMVPEHYWRDRDLTEPTLEPPLQSGPYKITLKRPQTANPQTWKSKDL